MPGGEETGGGEHVLLVDGEPSTLRKLPPAVDLADAAGEHSLRDTRPAVPEHATRADDQVDLAEVLPAAFDDTSLGADHDLAPPGMTAEGEADRRLRDLLVLGLLRVV